MEENTHETSFEEMLVLYAHADKDKREIIELGNKLIVICGFEDE